MRHLQPIDTNGLSVSPMWSAAQLLIGELRAAKTARAALLAALGQVISQHPGAGAAALFSDLFNDQPCQGHVGLRSEVTGDGAKQARIAIEEAIVDVLRNAVDEGELPERTEVAVLGALCMSALMGFGISAADGRCNQHLPAAIQMLVDSLGLHREMAPKRRGQRRPAASVQGKQEASA